ncbi:MAG: caspase family protein [Bacteroidota bacterium]
MKFITIFLGLLWLPISSIPAQLPTFPKYLTLDTLGKTKVAEVLLLSNGDLAGVGTLTNEKGKQKGLFFLLDGKNGQVKTIKEYGDDLYENVLRGMTQTRSGHFYLVGYQIDTKNKKKAWWLKVDGSGTDVSSFDNTLKKIHHQFEKVVALPDNSIITAGYASKRRDGYIWLTHSVEGKIKKQKRVGDGSFLDIAGMHWAQDSTVWLAGNTKKTRRVKKGNVWIGFTNSTLRLKKQRFLENEGWQQIHTTTMDYWHNLVIAGRWGKPTSSLYTTWLQTIALKDGQQTKITKPLPYDGQAKAVVATVEGTLLALAEVVPDASNPKKVEKELYLGKDSLKNLPLNLDNLPISFDPVKMVETYYDTYLIIGNNSATDSVELVMLDNSRAQINAKSTSDLSLDGRIFTLYENERDSCFGAGESGTLTYQLRNNSDQPITHSALVLDKIDVVPDLSFPQDVAFLRIPAHGIAQRDFQVVGEKGLGRGQSIIELRVMHEGTKMLSFWDTLTTVVCAQNTNIVSGVFFTNLSGEGKGKSREIPVPANGSYLVEGIIIAPLKGFPNKLTILKNSEMLLLEKEQQKILGAMNAQRNGLATATFKYQINAVDRQSDRDTFLFSFGEAVSDTLFVNYETTHPTLHILAIGPTYKDLNFPAKDAKEFALKLQKNTDTQFFKKVNILDTLVSESRTNVFAIQSTFEKLAKKYVYTMSDNQILSTDYLVVFYSGHGVAPKNVFKLVGSGNEGTINLESTTIDYTKILGYLNQIDCIKILFLDACKSGQKDGAKNQSDMLISRALRKANETAEGTAVFTSSSVGELSYESDYYKNGVFTEALLELLDNPIAAKQGLVNIRQIGTYLKNRVPILLKNANATQQQHPTYDHGELSEDLVIFDLSNY